MRELQNKEQARLIAALKTELSQKEASISAREQTVSAQEKELMGKQKTLDEILRRAQADSDRNAKTEAEFVAEKEKATKEITELQDEYRRKRDEVSERREKLVYQQKELDKRQAELEIELEKARLKNEFRAANVEVCKSTGNVDPEGERSVALKEMETRIRELDLLKRQKNLEWNENELAKKIAEVNALIKAVMPRLGMEGKREFS